MFEKLKELVDKTKSFYSVSNTHEGEEFTTFSYRMGSYGDFKNNEHLYSLESRGITFRNTTGECVSRPMHKFFNINENPYTANIDLDDIESIEFKEDGSLMSTVKFNDTWFIKSKTSFKSDQCKLCDKFLSGAGNHVKVQIDRYLKLYPNRTINFELVSPLNQIVLMYSQTSLRILNIRDNQTGEYFSPLDYFDLSMCVNVLEVDNKPEFVSNIHNLSEVDGKFIEGYVVKLNSGQWFKVKTDKYVLIHRAVGGISSRKAMLDVILHNAVDDFKSNCKDSIELIKPLVEMELVVIKYYNNMVQSVEDFTTHYSNLNRKEFAILAKKVYPEWHGLIMSQFNKKHVDYSKWMTKYYLDSYYKQEVL